MGNVDGVVTKCNLDDNWMQVLEVELVPGQC